MFNYNLKKNQNKAIILNRGKFELFVFQQKLPGKYD